MLKSLFSSSIRADVLSLLLNSPGDKYYVREIAKLLKKNPSGIKRELDNLERMGILFSEKVANLKYFQANRESPLFTELKDLLTKSLGLSGALKAVLRAAGVKAACIYGPYAEGLSEDKVDMLIIGAAAELTKEFRNIERKLGCTITWIELEEEEYKARKRKKDPKIRAILAGKRIPLIGRV